MHKEYFLIFACYNKLKEDKEMLDNYYSEISAIKNQFDGKATKKLHINRLLNLSSKLLDYEDQLVENIMIDLKNRLMTYQAGDFNYKAYNKTWSELVSTVEKKFGLVAKGTKQATSMSLGMCFGVAIGTALMSNNPAMLSIGIGCGLAIGSGYGAMLEKKLVEKGLIY